MSNHGNGNEDSGNSINTIVYRLNQMAETLSALADRVDTKYVRFDLFEAKSQLAETERLQMAARIEKLEQRSEWLIRAVGGSIVTIVIGAAVAGLRALGH